MDSYGLRDAFRADVDDSVAPFLWSDDLIALYADDAQKKFCRLTNGIADSSSDLCSVDIEAGEPIAAIDKRILRIRRAQRDSDGAKLDIWNLEDLDSRGIRLTNVQGPVRAVVLGMDEHTVRWLDVPQLNDTATLSVYRLPLRDITTTKSQLEIDSQHHFALLMWMKHLAYARQDTDTHNEQLSQRFEAEFRAYCKEAKAEQDRARGKIRVVAYGGI
jgi:hypothetical protein